MLLNKIVGYYKSWDPTSPTPENIDRAYNYIIYAFLSVDNHGNLDFHGDEGVNINTIRRLRSFNSGRKLLLSVGGWNVGSVKFSNIAADRRKVETMADSALSLMQQYSFDGLDIDWEYPAQNGGSPADRHNFVNMLRIIRNKFARWGSYLLTIAVSPLADPSSYDIRAIADSVDFINVMTYDFHQASQGRTGHNAPLYASSSDSQWEKENSNCKVAIQKWCCEAPPSKIVMGLAFYGQRYRLTSGSKGVGAPAQGAAEDTMTYKQIAGLRWTKCWDSYSKVPYKYSANEWIGYDDADSIAEKVRFARANRLGGVMVWTINDDNGDLIRAIKSA